jgi:hypothetical protein
MNLRFGRISTLTVLLTAAGLLAACGRPSIGLGYRIPGTPVSIGGSVPIGPNPTPADRVVYREFQIDSDPQGAEIYINNGLAGTTPSSVAIPFEKGIFGGAKGSAMILLKRKGFLADGFRVYAAGSKGAALLPDGPPTGGVKRVLRKDG